MFRTVFRYCNVFLLFINLITHDSIVSARTIGNQLDSGFNKGYSKASALLKPKCDPCPKGIQCVPQIQCPAHIRMDKQDKPQICDLPSGNYGLCCTTGQNHTANPGPKSRIFGFHLPDVAFEEARSRLAFILKNVAGTPVQQGMPDFFHNIMFHSNGIDDMESFEASSSALEEVMASQIFREMEQIPIEEFMMSNIDVGFDSSPLGHHCKAPLPCSNPSSAYRTFDGTCNNAIAQRSMWGAAGQPMERLLVPNYEDGVWNARIHSVDGSLLTSAREISRILLVDVDRPHPKHNLLVMQFGQFIAHDITQSSSYRLRDGSPIECCTPDGSGVLPTNKTHFACMPIPIEPHDEFYSRFNQGCMNFVRLSLSPNSNCKVGYGRQRSKVTHFLDGSPIYGSSIQTAKELRLFRGGQLEMLSDFGRPLLPLTEDKEACGGLGPDKICFKSGDGRTNQIISLVAIHILFAREHNRVADALSHLNPHFSDETLFQEARRIVIAELQHIVYNEYLPIVIGASQMKRFQLEPKSKGYSEGYSVDINPAVTNEFTGAAFRFGHSTIAGKFHVHADNQLDEVIDIPDVMFNPSRIRKPPFLDGIMNTMLEYPLQKVDASITQGVSKFLFRGGNPFGLDLGALNIQRGRDHALRSYNTYLELIGGRKIQNFNQFPPEVARKLSMVYQSPDDIDLWIGGLLEGHVNGGLVGPTFSEIIADQFSRLKRGDRYFYEFSSHVNPGAFTETQLNEIRKSTMARIICDNADHIALFEVSPNAFIRPDFPGNKKVQCSSTAIPVVNLDAWKA